MALKPGILVKDGKQMGYPQIGSSYTAGDYIEIDGNEISVNPVVPNENITYEFKTKDASGSDATITLIKKSGDTVISSTDYNYHSVMGNNYITVDDLFYFGYSTTFTASASSWGYKLLVASEDHAVDYTRIWTYDNVVDYTENFTNIDHSGECLVLKAQMDAALKNKQDTLTFDSVPTDGSTNPVESNGVYDALATKQDATDNNLQTTAKTVVGGINELNSNLTDLQEWTDTDTKTVTGNPITIADAAAVKAEALSMSIEPIQDLHGYDKPWVGGAGKNKLPLTVSILKSINTSGTWNGNIYTYNGVSIEVLTDESNENVHGFNITGTANRNVWFRLTPNTTDVSADTILSGCPASGSGDTYCIRMLQSDDTTSIGDDFGSGLSISSAYNNVNLYIRIASGYACPSGGLTFLPMIRLSTETDATFAPYTNICPISGLTSGDIVRTGKNLIGIFGYWHDVDGAIVLDAEEQGLSSIMLPVSAGQKFTCSKTNALNGSSGHTRVLKFDSGKNYIDKEIVQRNNVTGSTTYTIPSGVSYVAFTVYMSNADWADKYSFKLQVELGDTSSTYEPYNSATATITFGQTVYGGTVDFDSGVMTVDRAILGVNDFAFQSGTSAGGLHYAQATISPNTDTCISNMLETKGSNSSWNSETPCVNVSKTNSRCRVYVEETSGTDFSTNYADLQVVYELATPTTVQLTPQQIQLLKGQNTITANGATISLTYQPDNLVGEVMEQVDDIVDPIEARVATLENAIANEHRLIAESGTTGTLSAKIDGLYSAYAALTDEEKRRCFLVYGDTFNIHNVSVSNRKFGSVGKLNVGNSFVESVFIQISESGSTMVKLTVNATGNSFEDMSSTENSNKVQLYI